MSRCSLNLDLMGANRNHLGTCPCFCCDPVKIGQTWKVLPDSAWFNNYGPLGTVIEFKDGYVHVNWGTHVTGHPLGQHVENMKLIDET